MGNVADLLADSLLNPAALGAVVVLSVALLTGLFARVVEACERWL